MSWEIRVYAMTAPATAIGIVGEFESFAFEDLLSDVGAAHVVLGKGAVPDAWLETDTLWRFEEDGARRGALLVEAVEDLMVDEDHENERIKVSGRSTAGALSWAVVLPAGYPTSMAARTWTDLRPYPGPLHTFYVEAQARGTVSFLTLDWDETADSDGSGWVSTTPGEQQAGDDLLTLTTRWAGLQPYDWHVDADFHVRMWQQAGSDRSATVVLEGGSAIAEQTVTRVRRELRNVLYVEDTSGRVTGYDNPASIALWNRREAYLRPTEAVNDFSASVIAIPLMRSRTADSVERIVKTNRSDTSGGFDVGYRMWTDIVLGDLIGVRYPDGITTHRALGFVVAVDDKGNEDREIVLDTVLKATRDVDGSISEGSGTGGFGSSAPVLLYSDNPDAMTVSSTVTQTTADLAVEAASTTNANAGLNVSGTASGAQVLTVEVLKASDVARTIVEQIPRAGAHVVGIPWIQLGIPQGAANWRLRLKTDTGTFAIPPQQVSWWLQSENLLGGIGAGSPDVLLEQAVPVLGAVTTSRSAALQTPLAVGPSESVAVFVAPTATITVTKGFAPISTTGGNDGWTSTVPGFDNSSNLLQAGNSSAEIRQAFMRFVLPENIAGKTIVKATVALTADANMALPVALQWAADTSGVAAAPVSKATFDAAPKTTARVPWSTTVVAGTVYTTPDLKTVVQEVATSGGATFTSLVLYLLDGPAALNQWLTFRAGEHGTGPAPTLTLQWV